MEKFLKYFAVAIFLFIFYLYSGGIYKYNFEHGVIRINKVTGTLESLKSGKWRGLDDVVAYNMIKNFKSLDIFDDDEFHALAPDEKRRIILNYFDKEVANADFYEMNTNLQTKIKDAFVRLQFKR